jgi:hypothetical protein
MPERAAALRLRALECAERAAAAPSRGQKQVEELALQWHEMAEQIDRRQKCEGPQLAASSFQYLEAGLLAFSDLTTGRAR